MSKICGAFSLLVLTCSAAVHLSTYFAGTRYSSLVIFAFHAANLASIFPVFIAERMDSPSPIEPRIGDRGIGDRLHRLSRAGRVNLTKVLRHTPPLVRSAVTMIGIYAAIAFVYSVLVSPEGKIQTSNGVHTIVDNRGESRELSETEYQDYSRTRLRGFSAVWLAFSSVPTAYFLFSRPKSRDSSEEHHF